MNKVFYDIFSNLPRQGPGKNEYTNKAFHFIPALPEDAKIVDIGCGTGMQTMELARISFGEVTGIDNYEPYIDELKHNAKEEGLDNLDAKVGDMFDLDMDYGSCDLIWSEGSIYLMGFENGLEEWKRFLKPGGFMAVSEIAWFEDHRPKELTDFWEKEQSEILFQHEQEEIINRCGYEIVESFKLPNDAWWDHFYVPLENRLVEMRDKYADNDKALELIEFTQLEIDISKKFSDYFGYIFYIMMKK